MLDLLLLLLTKAEHHEKAKELLFEHVGDCYSYVDLLKNLRFWGKDDEALYWGEKALKDLGKKESEDVRKILADIYQERLDFSKAFRLCLLNFKSNPSIKLYQRLALLSRKDNL